MDPASDPRGRATGFLGGRWDWAADASESFLRLPRLVGAAVASLLPHRAGRPGPLPADIVPMMMEFGRSVFNAHDDFYQDAYGGSRAVDLPPDLPGPVVDLALAEPEVFVTALAGAVVPASGWAAYGAARTVTALYGRRFDHPAYHEILAASLDFLRDSGVPVSRLDGDEWDFWQRTRGHAEPWLLGSPAPRPEAGAGLGSWDDGDLNGLDTLPGRPG